MVRKEQLLMDWANSLPKNERVIEIDVLTIPKTCNEDGSLRKTLYYNHGYYFRWPGSPICQAYNKAGFSFVSYDEVSRVLKLKRSVTQENVPEVLPNVMEKKETDDVKIDGVTDIRSEGAASDTEKKDLRVIEIKDLKNKRFYIPAYQRGYRWTDEAADFVKDIKENKSDEYLLQPIVVKRIKENRKYMQRLENEGDDVIHEIKTTDGDELIVTESEPLFELIDGQQRLTTLFLTLRACGVEPEFEIFYENKRPLDNRYINLAKTIIKDELPKDKKDKDGFVENSLTKARYIWYEDNTSRTAEEVFRSLNADKTELTSAELFKALMLNNPDEKKRRFWADRLDEMEIRLNDENLWRFMADNKYISNRIELILNIYAHGLNQALIPPEGRGRRNLFAEKAKSLDVGENKRVYFDSRYAFLSLSNYMDYQKKNKQSVLNSDEIGDAVFDIFETLCSWHRDYRTHNLVGYLIARKGPSYEERVKMIYELYDVSRKEPFDRFVTYLYLRISAEDLFLYTKDKKHIPCKVSDKTDESGIISFGKPQKCYNLLLLSNVICAMKGRSFFDFTSLKDKYNFMRNNRIVWDIEHINPREPDGNLLELQASGKKYTDFLSDEPGETFNGVEGYYVYHKSTIMACLRELENSLESKPESQEKVRNLLKAMEGWKSNDKGHCICGDKDLNDKVSDLWKAYANSLDADNSFSNLALLSSDINRKYHNMPYGEKCLIVQHDDEVGHFIPTMTKRVFTARKYVKEGLWDNKAKESYIEDIKSLLQEVWGKAKDSERLWNEPSIMDYIKSINWIFPLIKSEVRFDSAD